MKSTKGRRVVAAMIAICAALNSRAFAPGAASPPDRPQERSIGSTMRPYRESIVSCRNPSAVGVRLAGTLTLPPGAGKFPAVVLISGSGPNGRNEEFSGHKPAMVLADALTRHGYAVLRYDKRGIAHSTGDYDAATTLDFASDAAAAVAYLRGRSDIEPSKVGLIGHSEGATIAAMVAAKDPRLLFVVMMAGFAIPGQVLVAEQNRRVAIADGQTPQAATRAYNLDRTLYAAIAASQSPKDAEARVKKILLETTPKPEKNQADMAILFTQMPYMRFILSFDPAPIISQVRVPVLALYGSKDLVTPPDINIPALRHALINDNDVSVSEMPGLNHFFQHANTGSPSEFEKIDETLAPEVLEVILAWIAKHTLVAVGEPGDVEGRHSLIPRP